HPLFLALRQQCCRHLRNPSQFRTQGAELGPQGFHQDLLLPQLAPGRAPVCLCRRFGPIHPAVDRAPGLSRAGDHPRWRGYLGGRLLMAWVLSFRRQSRSAGEGSRRAKSLPSMPAWVVLSALAGVCLAGCGAGAVVRVQGKVTVNGDPLAAGVVIFQPDSARDNSSQQEVRGVIRPDGTYDLLTNGRAGAAPGWYK